MNTNKRPLPSHDGEGAAQTLFASSPIDDRQSTFIAHFHPHDTNPSTSAGGKPTSLTLTVKAFQNHASFASADHRMVAWRRPSTQRTLGPMAGTAQGTSAGGRVICTTGSDDDGEKYAGKRLERVLIELDVQGTVVVARWYGGILLGPVRFTHIENAAKEAILKWKQGGNAMSGDNNAIGASAKRQKFDEEANPAPASAQDKLKEEAERARLAKQLADRDNSITVLRGLLAEKKRSINPAGQSSSQVLPESSAADGGSQATISSPSAKKMDYTEMPLQRLRQLDKARDASIAFILKQIDKAEEDEKKFLDQIGSKSASDTDDEGHDKIGQVKD